MVRRHLNHAARPRCSGLFRSPDNAGKFDSTKRGFNAVVSASRHRTQGGELFVLRERDCKLDEPAFQLQRGKAPRLRFAVEELTRGFSLTATHFDVLHPLPHTTRVYRHVISGAWRHRLFSRQKEQLSLPQTLIRECPCLDSEVVSEKLKSPLCRTKMRRRCSTLAVFVAFDGPHGPCLLRQSHRPHMFEG